MNSYQEQDAVVSTTLQENLTGVRVVKAFARQQFEIEKFDKDNWEKYHPGQAACSLCIPPFGPYRIFSAAFKCWRDLSWQPGWQSRANLRLAHTLPMPG